MTGPAADGWATGSEGMSAWEEVLAWLEDDEPIEAVVFSSRQGIARGDELVPPGVLNRLLSAEAAAPLMDGWRIGDAALPPQPMLLWTDRRTFTIAFEPEGARLIWARRDPTTEESIFPSSRP